MDKKPITNEKDKGNQINKIKKNIKINPIKFKINENDDIAQKIFKEYEFYEKKGLYDC